MRNKILRSAMRANTKYHYFYAFYNKINTAEVPLMYSCFFFFGVSSSILSVFLALMCSCFFFFGVSSSI